jgi:hypothetical protein
MRLTRTTFAASIAALALVAAGCGDSGDSAEDDVKDAANGFYRSIKDKDFTEACDLLTDQTKKQLEDLGKQLKTAKGSGGGCKEVLEASDKAGAFKNAGKADSLDFEEVKVDGDSATVKTKGDSEPTQFKKIGGEWKIDIKSS